MAAALAWASPLAAQADVAGRWRVYVEGLAPAAVLGELRLVVSGERCEGTLALSLDDRPPTPLSTCRVDEQLTFAVPSGDGTLRFSGAARARRLEGRVLRDGESAARWSAEPLPEAIEFYPTLPRFTLTQVVGGAARASTTLPGPVVAAARAGPWEASLDSAYRQAARRAGLAVLPTERLVTEGPARMLGLHERAATMAAAARALARIRALLPEAERAAFDRAFAGRDGLRTDLHGVAMEFARRRVPDLTWARVASVLQLRLPAGADAEQAAVRALLRLRSGADTVTVATVLVAADSAARETLTQLLDAYERAEGWHRAAIAALLQLHWVPDGSARRSPAELVRTAWAASTGDSAAPPALESRAFGDPQAVPRYGVPAALLPQLARPENWSAEAWLARHGPARLLDVVHRLDWPALDDVAFAAGDERLQLTSVPRLARASLNGFLESADAIALEPSYVPVLALGAVVHEWLHLLVETRRMARGTRRHAGSLVLPATDPWLAEGLAEAWSERVLAPAHAAVPLTAVGEVEKRARLARTQRDDPHVLGYLAVRAALGAAPAAEADRMLARLVDAPDLAALAGDPAAAAAWQRFGDAPDVVLPVGSRRVVVPETTFTVQDGVPDAVRATIRALE